MAASNRLAPAPALWDPMLLLLALACVKPTDLPQADDPVAYLLSTPWTELCPGSDPAQSWLQLHADGTFAFAYVGSTFWRDEGDETWTLEGSTLTISWNGGYATSTYQLDQVGQVSLPGVSSKSCGEHIQLVAAPEGPDFTPGPTGYEEELEE